MTPWLATKGDKEKTKRLRQIAEKMGLEVRLYTEQEDVDITFTIPSKSKRLESILKIPPNLIKTYNALMQLKEAQAEQVAAITKRARAYESHKLKRLYEEGHISRRNEGRKVFYGIID